MCHDFLIDAECKPEPVSKRVQTWRVECTSMGTKTFCFNVPKSICRPGVGYTCYMVPRWGIDSRNLSLPI